MTMLETATALTAKSAPCPGPIPASEADRERCHACGACSALRALFEKAASETPTQEDGQGPSPP